jgi:hypothetical protein
MVENQEAAQQGGIFSKIFQMISIYLFISLLLQMLGLSGSQTQNNTVINTTNPSIKPITGKNEK